MKKMILMVVLMAAAVCGAMLIEPLTTFDTLTNKANCKIIVPTDNIETAYDSLIADTTMGTLSATNRRTLILLPGTYTLTSEWAIDTNYVDIISASGDYNDTIVQRLTDGNVARQTAYDVTLKGFTIYANNTAGKGLVISNAQRFTGCTTATRTITKTGIGTNILNENQVQSSAHRDKVFVSGGGTNNTWHEITDATADSITINAGEAVLGTCSDVAADICPMRSNYIDMCFRSYTDNPAYTSDTGELYNPIEGIDHLGGNFYRITTGHNGLRCWRELVGVFVDGAVVNDGGYAQFAVTNHRFILDQDIYITNTTNYNTMHHIKAITQNTITVETTYIAENFSSAAWSTTDADMLCNTYYCSLKDYSFGGDLTREINGSHYFLLSGDASIGACGGVGSNIGSDAYFYGCKVIGSGWAKGRTYKGTSVNCIATGGGAWAGVSSSAAPGRFKGTCINCTAGFITTGNSFGMKSVTGSGTFDGGVLINCRIGTVADMLAGISKAGTYDTFTGGVIQDCGPKAPIAKTASFTAKQFDNGAIYTNTGDTNELVMTLPLAVVGLKYTLRDVVDTAGADVTLNPADADAFVLLNNTVMAAGEAYLHIEDAFGEVAFECKKAGFWHQVQEIGTWAQETP